MEHIDARTFDDGIVPKILIQFGTFMHDLLTPTAQNFLTVGKELATTHTKETLVAMFLAGTITMSPGAIASNLNNVYTGIAVADVLTTAGEMITGEQDTVQTLNRKRIAGSIGTIGGGLVDPKNAGVGAAVIAIGSNVLLKAATPDPMKNTVQYRLNNQDLLINQQSGQVFDANSRQHVGTYDARTNTIRDFNGVVQYEHGGQQNTRYQQPSQQYNVQYQQPQQNASQQQLQQEFSNAIGPKYNAAVKAYADGNNVLFQTNCSSAMIGMQRAAAVGVRFQNEYTNLVNMGCNVNNNNSRSLLPN